MNNHVFTSLEISKFPTRYLSMRLRGQLKRRAHLAKHTVYDSLKGYAGYMATGIGILTQVSHARESSEFWPRGALEPLSRVAY
jgi:hypothetical protein